MKEKRIDLHIEVVESPKEKESREKRERCKELILTIAAMLIITSLVAGTHVLEIWSSPVQASDFDVFLFFYAIIGLPLGLCIWGAVNYALNDKMGSWKWWYLNT
ncbi:MAG TPA: hypothetical protein DIS88_00480 [Prevotella sp.]|nr:hypothetical protein [Prevotella sp.]